MANVASSIIRLEQRGGACLAPGKSALTGPSKGEAPQLQRLELASKMVPAWQTAVEAYMPRTRLYVYYMCGALRPREAHAH
jgi:hypothetical protein